MMMAKRKELMAEKRTNNLPDLQQSEQKFVNTTFLLALPIKCNFRPQLTKEYQE